MTLIQLQYFVEVAQQKNFTKAAEVLHVSQSTLSKSVRALENDFEMEFIDRSSKEFLLTREGHWLYEYARRVLDFYQMQTRELYDRLHESSGTLHIGIPSSAGTAYFNQILHRFHKAYPDVKLSVNDSHAAKSVLELLEAGKLDMGVLLGEFHHPNYQTCEAFRSEVMLIVPRDHRLAGRSSVTFSELKDEQFLMMSPDYMFHDLVLECCHSAGFTPYIAMYSYQWDLVYEMVAAGKGIGFLPITLMEKYSRTDVKPVHLTDPEFPWVLTLAYRKDKYVSPAMRQFLKICKETT